MHPTEHGERLIGEQLDESAPITLDRWTDDEPIRLRHGDRDNRRSQQSEDNSTASVQGAVSAAEEPASAAHGDDQAVVDLQRSSHPVRSRSRAVEPGQHAGPLVLAALDSDRGATRPGC